MMNREVDWIRNHATDSQIAAILDQRDQLLALFTEIFDAATRDNFALKQVTLSIKVDVLDRIFGEARVPAKKVAEEK